MKDVGRIPVCLGINIGVTPDIQKKNNYEPEFEFIHAEMR
jgi:hypothetical protein